MKLLDGIRVLEISDGLVDFGGHMLAELGADVVAIVPDAADEPSRSLAFHHGKTRLVADSSETVAELASRADVILDGQRLGDRFDLGASPNAIHIRVRPFSDGGPMDGRPANDLTLMALSGLMTVIGDPEAPLLRFPGRQAYALTGIQAATAALMGLYARRRIGRGQTVSLSALQSATLANYREPVMYEWTGRIGKRQGNLLVRGKSGVRQVWPCRDGHVTWSMIDNPPMMRALVSVLAQQGVAGELADIDWDNTLVADTPQPTIDRWQQVVGDFFARHTRAELGEWSLEKGWGLSVINTPQDVRESDHLADRGLFVEVRDEESGHVSRVPGPLFKSSLPMQAPDRTLKAPVPASAFDGWSVP